MNRTPSRTIQVIVALLVAVLFHGLARAEEERSWEPDSFAVQLYGSPTVRTRISYKVFSESLLEQVPGSMTGLQGPSPVFLNHTRMGPDLEVALWPGHLSIFGQASFSTDYAKGFGISASHKRMDSALGGIKLGGSTRYHHMALGVGVGTVNLDSDRFAGSDALVVQPFASVQFRGGPLVLGGTVGLAHVANLQDMGEYLTSLSYSGRLAVSLCSWLALQGELSGTTLVLQSESLSAGTDIRTLLDAHGGLRFGSKHFSMGLGGAVPVNHRDQRYDFGLHADMSVVF